MVASVTVFIATSILFTFIGFLWGHFYQQKQNTVSTAPSTVDPRQDDLQPRQHAGELQLEVNVAYGSAS